MLARSMEAEGVLASIRAIDEEPSGRVLVMVDPHGHRRMWSYPGASRTLSPGDLDPAWFEDLDAFHLTGYSLLREGPRAAALEALRLARAGGSPLCTLDPNPPHLIADFGPQRFREMVANLGFDVIFPNLEEGQLLSGKRAPEAVAADLLEVSPVVALTLGSEGCLVASARETFKSEACLIPVTVDATGAGDAFAAGFVVEYPRGRDLRAAAATGNRLAAEVVGRPGGR
jgi:sugar/nucleoside kinase (ribokinase family)